MPESQGTIVFIDENMQDQKIGVLSVPWPPAPQQIIARIRERYCFYDEMKWSTISRVKVGFLTAVIEAFFSNNSFGRINVLPIATTVDTAIFEALNSLQRHCAPYHGIFMDDHTTPKGYDFERRLKASFHCPCVLRLDSKASAMLQLCDLMMNLTIRAASPDMPDSPHKAALVEVFKKARDKAPFRRCFMA
jgi:hypothetical protein